jgi:hypothetical protein
MSIGRRDCPYKAGTTPKHPEAHPLHVDAGERGRKQMMRRATTFQTLQRPVLRQVQGAGQLAKLANGVMAVAASDRAASIAR